LLAATVIVLLPSAYSARTKEYYVEMGTVSWEVIEPSDEKVWLNITVVDNVSAIDVYIMLLGDFSENSYLTDNFTDNILGYYQNVTLLNFSFEPPDDENYVLIMDNSDNILENDTVPREDVLVEVRVKYLKSERPMTIKGIVVSVMSLIFIIYTLHLYYVKRKRHRRKREEEGSG